MKKTVDRRILIIDDNPAIHEDFKKILITTRDLSSTSELKKMHLLFSEQETEPALDSEYFFEIDSAFQGLDGIGMVADAVKQHRPYALAFVDTRMPPGMDGIETIRQLWSIDPHVQIVICTAYSDYSWKEIQQKLGHSDQLLILKKPFDTMEVLQLAYTMTDKWILRQQLDTHINNLQKGVEASSDGIIIFQDQSAHFSIIYANASARKMLDIQEDTEKSFITLLIRSHRNQPNLGLIQQALENKTGGRTDLSYTRNGKDFWYQINVSPIYNNDQVVDRFVGILTDITETKQLSEQVIYQTTHDPLTGLTSRVLLIDRMQQYISLAKRYNFLVAVLFIDLDNFKEINEQFGRDTGDALLQNVAQTLLKISREADTVARIGGDEFILVTMPVANEQSCFVLVERINDYVRKPITIHGEVFNLTCSIGVTLYPNHGADPSTLIKNADIALFSAKESGRNTWQYFDENLLNGSKPLILKEELQNALKNNEFELFYQPLVDLHSNKITGMEALIRWHHPTSGLIMPMEFIPLAEESNLIVAIGDWVMKTACTQAKKWQERGIKDIVISINIAPSQMKAADFVQKVQQCLHDTKLKPEFLELEVTEHFVLSNIDQISNTLDTLRKMGVCLAMDDFGSGYSSLSFLKKHAFKRLKITRGILDNIHKDEEKKRLVKTIIDMANTLQLTVVAEGIETQEQSDILKNLGHPEIQGFYISPPVPRDAMYNLLNEKFSNLLD